MPTFAIFTHYIQNELIHHVTCCPRPYSHSSRLSSLHRLVCRCRAMATTKVWNFTGSQSWNWSWRWAWHQLTCVTRFFWNKIVRKFFDEVVRTVLWNPFSSLTQVEGFQQKCTNLGLISSKFQLFCAVLLNNQYCTSFRYCYNCENFCESQIGKHHI